MDGMSRIEVDRAESRDVALGKGTKRPRDAATLVLLDKAAAEHRVLMGRRHPRHAFMPGKFVFPGGRTDPNDHRVPVIDGLEPAEADRLIVSGRVGPARARAIAVSAIRETYEEAGLLIGRAGTFQMSGTGWQDFALNGIVPSLQALRYLARAITPPGRVRRFDTRFFVAWRDCVGIELPDGGPAEELQELVWLPLSDALTADIPSITKTILGELQQRLTFDPLLRPGGPVPFYRMVGNRFKRDLI